MSNSSPLPKAVLHAEAAAGPHHGKPAGAIGPSPYHQPVEPAYHEPAPHPHHDPIHNEYEPPTHGHPEIHGHHKPKEHHQTSCPYIPPKPPHACHSHPKGTHCWSEGVPDLDCPYSALCCFDGCSNTCLGPHHAIAEAPIHNAAYAPPPKQHYAHKDRYQTSYVTPGPTDIHHHSTASPPQIHHHSTTIAPHGGHYPTTMIPPTKLYQPPQTVYQQPRAMQPPTKLYQPPPPPPPQPQHHHQTSYKPSLLSPTTLTTMKPPVKQYKAPAHQSSQGHYHPPIKQAPYKQPYQSDFKTFEHIQTTLKPLHTTMHPPAKLYAPPEQHLAINHLGSLTPKTTMAPPAKLYQPPQPEAIFTSYKSTLKPLHSTSPHPQPAVRLYGPPSAPRVPATIVKPTVAPKIITSSLPSLLPGPFVTPLPAMLSLDPTIIQPHLPSHGVNQPKGFDQTPLSWSGPKPRLLPNGIDQHHQPKMPLDHQTFMMGPHPKPPAALSNFVTPLPSSPSSPSSPAHHPHPVVSHSSESGVHHPGPVASSPPAPSIQPALGEPRRFLPPMLHMPVSPRTLEEKMPVVTESPNAASHPVELTTMIAFVRAMQEHKLPPGFNAIPAVPVEEKPRGGMMPRPPPLPSPPLLAMIEDGSMQCQPSGPNRQFTCFPIDQQAPFPQTNQQEILPGGQNYLKQNHQSGKTGFSFRISAKFANGFAELTESIPFTGAGSAGARNLWSKPTAVDSSAAGFSTTTFIRSSLNHHIAALHWASYACCGET